MPIRGEKGSGAPATASDLESPTITGRIRADGVDLSAAERKFIQDPYWITEDDPAPDAAVLLRKTKPGYRIYLYYARYT